MSVVPRPTLQEAISAYTTHLRAVVGRSENTIKSYRSDLMAACEGLDELEEFTLDRARDVLGWQADSGAARSSIARMASSMKGFGAFLVHKGWVESNPVAALKAPSPQRTLPRVLRVDQATEILEAARTRATESVEDPFAIRDWVLLETLFATGVRVSELVGINLNDIDDARRLLRVTGKGNKSRAVPYGQTLSEALDLWLPARARALSALGKTHSASANPLFIGKRGGRLDQRQARTVVNRLTGVDGPDAVVSPHAIRHSTATAVLDGGADLRVVQELLGHASMNTTQIYTHVSNDRLRAVYDQAHPRSGR